MDALTIGITELGALQGGELSLLAIMCLIVLGTFISEDLTCVGTGLLVVRGVMAPLPGVVACFLGIWLGDLLLYLLGRSVGPLLGRRPLRWWISPRALGASEDWFARRGAIVVVLGRFVPGTRLPTYVAAGVLKMPFWRFAAACAMACALWVPALLGLSIWIGPAALHRLEAYGHSAPLSLFTTALALWLLVKLAAPLCSSKGRRLMVGRWGRFWRWEFWSPWVFYPPVVLYVLALAVRHRSLALFSLANPGMPSGGFVNESKLEILGSFRGSEAPVAPCTAIPTDAAPGARLARVETFMQKRGLDYPVVLKPDQGQRGRGVAIVRSREACETHMAGHPSGLIVQQYVPGVEYGIFYARRPGEAQGQIISITEKQLPCLTGDGRHTLEWLILHDRRAVCMASFYLDAHHNRRFDVPDAGETVALAEIGTHCRGAVFRDGARLKTPALEKAIDRISRTFEGFHFGRYDLKVPSEQALREGKDLTILELNGVTSEATHIYDPHHSLFVAYRTLMRQWRLAFDIGAAHRRLGLKPTPLKVLWRELWLAAVTHRENTNR